MGRTSLLKNVLQKNSESSGHEAPKALTSRKSFKEYASSIQSAGGSTIRSVRSIAESVASFYSLMTGGSRIPKRRRPEISRLGVPKFYRKKPKPMLNMDGVKYLDTSELGPWTSAHAKSFSSINSGPGEAWASVVLYNHASPNDPRPIFHGRAKISGELRICLQKAMFITSIDVWLQGKQESVLNLAPTPFVNATANLWEPRNGDPTAPNALKGISSVPYRGKFSAGTYVFPFEFPALPRDVDVFQIDPRLDKPKNANVFLPPSHEISQVCGWVSWQKYIVGINIQKSGLMALHEEWDFKFDYFPRARPLLRPEIPFPLLFDHDEWPFSREELAGWVLTPFGGRGRFRDEIVEVEGILGIQAPAVYCSGQRIRFTLLLWSQNEDVLEAFASQESVQVDYVRSDVYGLDVLEPHNSARKNRITLTYGNPGRIWRNDDGLALTPTKSAPARIKQPPWKPTHNRTHDTEIRRSNYVPKRLAELYNVNTEDIDDTTTMATIPVFATPESPKEISDAAKIAVQQRAKTTEQENVMLSTDLGAKAPFQDAESIPFIDGLKVTPCPSLDGPTLSDIDSTVTVVEVVSSDTGSTEVDDRPVSPTLSLEDEDVATEKKGRIVRLDGDLVVPISMPPSYRYLYAGVEYSIHVILTHPNYSHISPRATGIVAETPIWIVTDPPRQPDDEDILHTPLDVSQLPKAGEAIRVPGDAIRFPMVIGNATQRMRPKNIVERFY